ncbi:MAG: hypothetical protein IM526_02670 [Microcystis sp. M38BS1]|uniref:beta strand repeat-containing protein n=1 Tax=Microcystis sp. M38BS1 TaxID=2771188 RepID=UPI0031FC86B9|nr:hypothetical protein [Microcystis sp. M38BS1]MCA6582564.1 hypothetical protein [Pseudanabaena sp. M34BS1SP1A06MG]
MSNQLQIFKGLVTSSGGGSSGDVTLLLGTFKAIGSGTGYSVDDLIFLQKVGSAAPVWYNATTNAVISAPDTADLGSVSSSNNVSVVSSTLPTGAATAANQLADNHQVTISNSVLSVNDAGGSLTVDGTVTANTGLSQPLTDAQLRNSAVPVSVASLPSHAVTNAGTFAVQSTNQANSGVDIGDVTVNNGAGVNAVNIQDGGNSITVDGQIATTQSGTWNVGVTSLPSGLATDTLQTAGNASLTSINNKIPALSAGSVPVTLPSAQITALTPPAAITGYATSVKQPALGVAGVPSTDVLTVQGIVGGTNLNIAGTVTANLSTTDRATATSSDASLSAINAKLVSGTDIGDVTINNASGGSAVNIQDGGNSITIDGSVAITGTAGTNLSSLDGKVPSNLTVTSTRLLVDGSGVTQPISGTVTANTGLSQPLTDTQLRASPPTVSLSSSNLTTLTPPAAITGFATEATLSSILTALNGNVNFSETIWTDDTGAYFARRVSQNLDTNTITVSYTLPDGSAYTLGANPRPALGAGGSGVADREIRSSLYNCNTSGTGYTTGDDIVRSDVIDVNTSSIIVTLWYNATAKTNIAAPTSGDLDYISTEGYSTSALQTTLNNAVGSASDSAATTDTGTFSLLSFVKRTLQNWTTLLGRIPVVGQTTKNLSIPVAIASDQNALPVTGTFWQATQPTTLTDGATTATVFDLTNSNPLSVGIVDGSGNQITSFGGGTQYTTGAAQATPTGTVTLGWDGGNVRALSTDNTGKLNIAGSVRLTDGTNNSTLLNLANSKPLTVAIVDAAGDQLASFGGGTQYNNGNIVVSPVGTVALGYDGDNVRSLATDDLGRLNVVSDDFSSVLSNISRSLIPLTNTDSSNRTLQTLDSISAGVTLPAVTTVTTVTTVGAVTAITNALPTGANTIGDVTIGGTGAGVGYDLYMMTMRSAYNTAILI